MTQEISAPSRHTRRAVITALGATALPILVPARLHASGGGGGGEQGAHAPPTTATRKTATDWSYTQRRFTRLSKREIVTLIKRWQNRSIAPDAESFRVEGFSPDMSSSLLWMALRYRRRTFRLMRDMQRLATPEARRARLKREEKEAIREERRYVVALRNTYSALEIDDPDDPVVRETKGRLGGARQFLRLLRVWMRNPMDGAY